MTRKQLVRVMFLPLVAVVSLATGCAESEGGVRVIGDDCAADGECVSRRCDELVCKSGDPASQGEPCDHPLECLSEVCTDEEGRTTCAPGIRLVGYGCTLDEQCASGHCVAGVCVENVDAGLPDSAGVDQTLLDSHRPDTTKDAGGPDTSVDAPAPDTSVDAPAPDSSVDAPAPDSSVDAPAPDSSVDAPAPDTSLDAPAPDTSVDAPLPDTSVDVLGPDLGPTPLHTFSQAYGAAEVDEGYDIAVAPNGDMILTGHFSGKVNFGGGQRRSAGQTDAFVARFDSTGQHLWSRSFGGLSTDGSNGVAITSQGNVVLVGSFMGTVDFGAGDRASVGEEDIFVVALDGNGGFLWANTYGFTAVDRGTDIAPTSGGAVVVTAFYRNTIDFGGGPLASAGDDDIVLLELDATGQHLWSKRLGSTGLEQADAIAVGPNGNIAITGQFSLTVDFGGGPQISAGAADIFVASFDSTGAHRWSRGFGGTLDDYSVGVAFDGAGNIAVAGAFARTMNCGGGDLRSSGSWDIFTASFDDTGAHRWSKRFGNTDYQVGLDVAADVNGNVVVGGLFYGGVDFGDGSVLSAGENDIFLASFNANGQLRWSRRYGAAGSDLVYRVALGANNEVYATGHFTDAVDFGGGPIASAGASDIFLLRLAP